MIYAKKMNGETVEILLSYNYRPEFAEGDGVVIISADEYASLRSALEANRQADEDAEKEQGGM